MPAGDMMHAPSGYLPPTVARIFLESVSRRFVRIVAGLTMVASMSSVNESNFWPPALRKSMAATAPLQSLARSVNPGQVPGDDLDALGVALLDDRAEGVAPVDGLGPFGQVVVGRLEEERGDAARLHVRGHLGGRLGRVLPGLGL